MENNFLLTPQRKIILEVISSLKNHPTVDEIFEEVRKQLPRISLGTVYRNLELMSENGLINKVETTGSAKRFDPITEHHYHLKCIQCGKVEDAPVKPDKKFEKNISNLTDYKITGHNLEFMGICPDCQKKNIYD